MRRILVILAALVLLIVAGGLLTLRSGWFREQVRARIVRELEKSTGGRVEIGAFGFDWKTRRASLRDLVIHGTEPVSQAPLFRAKSVTLGVKIVNAWKRDIDLASLEVVEPHVNIIASADGRTNIPAARFAQEGPAGWERILQFAVDDYRLLEGELHYASSAIPLDVHGKRFEAKLALDRVHRAYSGDFSAQSVKLARPLAIPFPIDLATALTITEDRIDFSRVRLSAQKSIANFESCAYAYSKTLTCRGRASGELASWIPLFHVPIDPQGRAEFTGSVELGGPKQWTVNGAWQASGIAAHGVNDISAKGRLRADAADAFVEDLVVTALGGTFSGSAAKTREGFALDGTASGFPLQALAAVAGQKPLPWRAAVSGPIRVEGPDLSLQANVRLTPLDEDAPLSGNVDVTWDQRSGRVRFGASFLELASTRINFTGTPAGIDLGFVSSDLADLEPLLSGAQLPIELRKGQVQFNGKWTGGAAAPHVQGRLQLGAFRLDQHEFQSMSGDIDATREQIRITQLDLAEERVRLQGYGSLALTDGKPLPESAISAKLTLGDSPIEEILRDLSITWPVTGTASTYLDVQGTYGAPRVLGHVNAATVNAWDESFERVEADVRYTERRIEVVNGRARLGAGSIDFFGSADQDDFRVQFELRNSRVQHWKNLAERQSTLDGAIRAKATIAAQRQGGKTQLTALEGEFHATDLAVGDRRVGDLTLTARTNNRLLGITLEGNLRDSRVRGSADWNLGGNSYGLGQLQVSHLTFLALRDLGLFGDPAQQLSVRGFVDAEVGFSGPVLSPSQWTGVAKVTAFEVEPSRQPTAAPQRFVLRNQEPLLIYMDSNGAQLQNVHLVAEGTDLEATGTIAYKARNPWNLRLRGRVNLPVLSAFEPELTATGVSTIDATIRGTLDKPNLAGRMELNGASVNFRNIPNGLEKLTGTVVFDRTRANVERLTAQTGGGELSLGGFIDFGGQDWVYRLSAQAQRVRVRYPDPLSVTFNGSVNLSGTSARSLLNGQVVVSRVALNPRTDIGRLLAESGRASSAGPSNQFLRNMQLDLQVENAPDAELQTSLARDVSPEANLRVRGNFERPSLLGRVSANQGEIQFFGNQYSIARGDISFYNPSKIEPIIDLDLETRVRGVTVNMNFSGPMNKLDVSYRSDPPLQSAEIVALLAVGRTPGSGITPNLPTAANNQLFLQQPGNNTLLGQAVTAPFNSRLQRLFGVSRIKIDPELTGVTNLPQARLTVEQQLSRDITVTYITNLNRTQQQIVRLQWDFSKDFSVLAVRDENGIFGVDFLWRMRFK
ncbi:MAG: translocation/assembly module TamB domain-containing protein [Bryobacteraceae bacterium]